MQEEKYGCQEVVDLLSDYVDGECAPGVAPLIDEHLSDCPNCVAFVNTLRKSMVMSKALGYSDIPKEVRIRLRRVLERGVPIGETPPDVHRHPLDRSDRTAEDEKRR
jgi:anti-sigma factor RsiW